MFSPRATKSHGVFCQVEVEATPQAAPRCYTGVGSCGVPFFFVARIAIFNDHQNDTLHFWLSYFFLK